jgi:hypothetical protein
LNVIELYAAIGVPETSAMAEKKTAESKEWALEPETEYRFELDPGTSLAIKVCPIFAMSVLSKLKNHHPL